MESDWSSAGSHLPETTHPTWLRVPAHSLWHYHMVPPCWPGCRTDPWWGSGPTTSSCLAPEAQGQGQLPPPQPCSLSRAFLRGSLVARRQGGRPQPPLCMEAPGWPPLPCPHPHTETGALQPMPACHGVQREADAGHRAPQLWWWPGANLAPSQGLPHAGMQGCVGPCNSSATRERSSCGSPGAAGSLTAGASSSWEKPWDLQHSFVSCFGAGAHHKKDPGRSPFCSTHAKASPTAGPGHCPPLQHPWDPFTHCWSSQGQAGMQIHRHRSSQ